jgi:zinc protease
MAPTIDIPPLAERVIEAPAGRVRVLALPTPAERIVAFGGSFLTLPDFAAGQEVAQQIAVALLEKGTASRDRFAIAEALDDRGARLGFSADGLRCSFAGRCLREDLPAVLELAADMLRQPGFDAEEFDKARAQQTASVRRIMEDTGSQAHGALARRLYGPSHPNFRPTPEEDLEHLARLAVDDVRRFHREHFGARDALAVFVGDLDPAEAVDAMERLLGDWRQPPASGAFETAARPEPAGRVMVPMDDRQNLDVRIGHPLALRRDHDDYLALYVGVYILGGNFAARLMSTVRDEQGLTYGIGAQLAGVAVEHDAYFLTSVTLSQDRLEEGIEATIAQIRRFAEGGITEAELEEKKTTLTGSFTVGLATTRGLAAALQANAERGFDVAYLDTFHDRIHALTVDEVNAAIRRHIDPAALHVAVAGSLPG